MELLASLFVAKPFNILIGSLLFLVVYLCMRFNLIGHGKSSTPMLLATLAWGLYAAWEWFVLVRSPEADIRVDLLIIWPILGLVMMWAVFKLFR